MLHGHSTHADLSCISCYSGAHVLFTCVLPVDLSCSPRCTRAAMSGSGYACSSHPNVSFVGTKRKGSGQKQLRKLVKGRSRTTREHIAQASCARTPSTPLVQDAGPAASATTVPEAPAVPTPHTHKGQTTGRWTIHQVEARAAGKSTHFAAQQECDSRGSFPIDETGEFRVATHTTRIPHGHRRMLSTITLRQLTPHVTGECASATELGSAEDFAASVEKSAHEQGLLDDVCWVNDTMGQSLDDSVAETLKGLARVNSISMPHTDDGTDDEGVAGSSDASDSLTVGARTLPDSRVSGARKRRSNVATSALPRKRPSALLMPRSIEV